MALKLHILNNTMRLLQDSLRNGVQACRDDRSAWNWGLHRCQSPVAARWDASKLGAHIGARHLWRRRGMLANWQSRSVPGTRWGAGWMLANCGQDRHQAPLTARSRSAPGTCGGAGGCEQTGSLDRCQAPVAAPGTRWGAGWMLANWGQDRCQAPVVARGDASKLAV
jgi:hypothetical protein